MQKIVSIIKWLFRAWPVLVPAILAIFHIVVSSYWAIDLRAANKVISLILQIFGGVLVLYSIDSNIGIVNNQSLFTLFNSWLKSFPLIKRSFVVNVEPGSLKLTGYPPKIRVGGPGKSMEERVEYLQQQIEWLKEDLNDEVKHLKNLISGVEQRSSKEISLLGNSVGVVENKISELSVGGIGLQVFGVLLVIHGAVASYYA
jgi:hypothetical protein